MINYGEEYLKKGSHHQPVIVTEMYSILLNIVKINNLGSYWLSYSRVFGKMVNFQDSNSLSNR